MEPEITQIVIEEEGIVEFTTREEYISCAVNCYNVVSEMNVLTNEDRELQQRVTRKSLKIIDTMCTEMYDELFDDESE